MMSDEELRARLVEAHRDDAPPSFAELTGRRRRRRRPLPLVLVPLVALAALVILWRRPPTPTPAIADVHIELHDPLAFLLDPPGADVLDGVPRLGAHFDEGELP